MQPFALSLEHLPGALVPDGFPVIARAARKCSRYATPRPQGPGRLLLSRPDRRYPSQGCMTS
jgi:hypothetical protein